MAEEKELKSAETQGESDSSEGEYRIVGAAKRVMKLERSYVQLEKEYPHEEIEKPKNVRPNVKVATEPMPWPRDGTRGRKLGRTMSDIKV